MDEIRAADEVKVSKRKPSFLHQVQNAYFSLFPVTDAVDKWDLIKLHAALPILLIYHFIVIGAKYDMICVTGIS